MEFVKTKNLLASEQKKKLLIERSVRNLGSEGNIGKLGRMV